MHFCVEIFQLVSPRQWPKPKPGVTALASCQDVQRGPWRPLASLQPDRAGSVARRARVWGSVTSLGLPPFPPGNPAKGGHDSGSMSDVLQFSPFPFPAQAGGRISVCRLIARCCQTTALHQGLHAIEKVKSPGVTALATDTVGSMCSRTEDLASFSGSPRVTDGL